MPLTIEDVIGKIENDRLFKQGMEQGREQGQKQASEKFISALLKDGAYPVERIATLSGETVEIVLAIKHKLENQEKTPPIPPKKKSPRKPPTKKDGE